MKRYWLVKSEPESYSFSQLVADKKTDWTGVRSYPARIFLREMRVGDTCLYYHSVEEKAVVGLATVSRTAFPDPTMIEDERKAEWVAVELTAGKPLAKPVTLAAIKAEASLKDMLLVKQSRLSVSPVTEREFKQIVEMSK